MAAKNDNQPTLDTSDPNRWVFSFDPNADLGPSSTGKSLGVVNHRETLNGITVNVQAYRKNPEYAGS